MKKVLSVLMAACIALLAFAGCSSTDTNDTTTTNAATTSATTAGERTDVTLGLLKGPTGIGAVKLLADNDAKTSANNYTKTIFSSPDEVTAKLISGELDIAAVPTNLSSVLYNKTSGKVQLAALNTLGVLYMVEVGNSIASINDLAGKTVYSSGQGAVPEYVLNYILKANGLTDSVKVVYKAEHSELATLLSSGKVVLGMLPEPNVTAVLTANKDARIALNITSEWAAAAEKLGDKDSVLSMGCVVVNTEFAKQNKAAVNAFLTEYEQSIGYVKTNVEAAAKLCEQYGIIPKAAVAKKAIPNCNLCYVDGEDMKTQITPFFNTLYNANKSSVGGKLPDDSFYYSK